MNLRMFCWATRTGSVLAAMTLSFAYSSSALASSWAEIPLWSSPQTVTRNFSTSTRQLDYRSQIEFDVTPLTPGHLVLGSIHVRDREPQVLEFVRDTFMNEPLALFARWDRLDFSRTRVGRKTQEILDGKVQLYFAKIENAHFGIDAIRIEDKDLVLTLRPNSLVQQFPKFYGLQIRLNRHRTMWTGRERLQVGPEALIRLDDLSSSEIRVQNFMSYFPDYRVWMRNLMLEVDFTFRTFVDLREVGFQGVPPHLASANFSVGDCEDRFEPTGLCRRKKAGNGTKVFRF